MNNISNKICLLTPSYIDTEERLAFASESYSSLTNSLNFDGLKHYVVDDSDPSYLDYLRQTKLRNQLDNLYIEGDPKIVYRKKPQGSASAVLEAVNLALDEGFKFGFIHLDDQSYNTEFDYLISAASEAMHKDEEIGWLRFSGYPLIHNGDKRFNFNDDLVNIDGISFSPFRSSDYTLWLSSFQETKKVNFSDYWTVALWHSLFRLEILKVILERGLSSKGGLNVLKRRIMGRQIHLCHVELTYRSRLGFSSLVRCFPNGKYGYVNMQFGGFEIHRNANWEDLMQIHNKPLR